MCEPIIFNPANSQERDKLLRFIAKMESQRGKEQLENGSRQPFPYGDIDAAIAYYRDNIKDGGRFGRSYEVMVRYYLTGRIEPVHPQGAGDVSWGKSTCEVKSSAGTLTPYIYASPDDIKTLYDSNTLTLARARYIIYSPFPETVNLLSVGASRVYTQRRFLQAAEQSNNLVIRSKSGLYGLGLKQFYQSNRQVERWLDALDAVPSVSLADFSARYNQEG